VFESGVKRTCNGIVRGGSVIDHVLVSQGMREYSKVKVIVRFEPSISKRHAFLLVEVRWKESRGKGLFPERVPIVTTASLDVPEVRAVAREVKEEVKVEVKVEVDRLRNGEVGEGWKLDKWWKGLTGLIREKVQKRRRLRKKERGKGRRRQGSEEAWKRVAEHYRRSMVEEEDKKREEEEESLD
jgi:hypothetical protein